jgi:hypothetical protein
MAATSIRHRQKGVEDLRHEGYSLLDYAFDTYFTFAAETDIKFDVIGLTRLVMTNKMWASELGAGFLVEGQLIPKVTMPPGGFLSPLRRECWQELVNRAPKYTPCGSDVYELVGLR